MSRVCQHWCNKQLIIVALTKMYPNIGTAILKYDVVSWICQNWCTKELIIIALLQKNGKTLVLQYSDMMWSHGFVKTGVLKN